MTDEESILLKKSQDAIKEESNKIADSITRILMLGGPYFVAAILKSFLETNKKIMSDLKIRSEIEFEEGEG